MLRGFLVLAVLSRWARPGEHLGAQRRYRLRAAGLVAEVRRPRHVVRDHQRRVNLDAGDGRRAFGIDLAPPIGSG